MSGGRACDVYRDVDVDEVLEEMLNDANLEQYESRLTKQLVNYVLWFFVLTSSIELTSSKEEVSRSFRLAREALFSSEQGGYKFLRNAVVYMEGSSLPSDPWRSRTIPLLVVLQQYLLGRVRKGQLTSDRGFYVAKPKPEKRLISTEAKPD